MDDQAISQNATGYSDSFNFENQTGEVAALIYSSAGSVTITQQCSHDNSHWFDAVDSGGNAAGAVGATLTSITGGKYITFTSVVAKYMRFKVTENNSADAVVNVYLIYQEDE